MEKISIFKLQELYKNNCIVEEYLSNDQKERLVNLYKLQNKELKEKINSELKSIKELLSYYKN